MKHREGKMAKFDAKEIAEDAAAVFKMIDEESDLPEWLEAKITKAADYMNSVKDYLTHHMQVNDAANPAQQAAIAIAKKKSGKYDKDGKKIKEGSQKDINNLALYIIDLRNMLGQAKLSKNPKAKSYVKLIQRDLKDASNKMAKLRKKNESVKEACWVGYKQVGMKKKGNKMVPNCVAEVYWENSLGESCGYTFELDTDNDINEAEYQGRKVKLGKPMQGDTKKFKVYVKNDKGNVVKVNFGQGGDAKGGTMRIRKDNPKARKSFRARHNCDNPGPRHKARYWSCRKW
tara:strand:- start:838 stop:1701 length:864 start_codon:yes stop_codon:yes gene_type:complete